jgi:hypothetical protein
LTSLGSTTLSSDHEHDGQVEVPQGLDAEISDDVPALSLGDQLYEHAGHEKQKTGLHDDTQKRS